MKPKITVKHEFGTFVAIVNGDGKLFETGKTIEEAIGKAVLCFSDGLEIELATR
jgi:hypothetical protein